DRHPLQPAQGLLPPERGLSPPRARLRRVERRPLRKDPDGIGAAHPARRRGVPVRPHLGADRRRTGAEVGLVRPLRASLLPLLLGSLALSAVLAFAYARRLGGDGVGAYFAGLSCALGPYMVGHLDDTATVLAAPLLFLLLVAVEAQLARGGPGRAAALAGSM